MNKLFSILASSPSEIIQRDVNDIVQRLFPNPFVVISSLISFLIIFIILFYLVQKPVKKMVKERKNFIQENIDESIQTKNKALELEKQRTNELEKSYITAAEIVLKAKIEAEKIVISYTDNAKNEAQKIMENARASIQIEKNNLKKEYKKQVIEISSLISSKVLEKEITIKDEDKLIKEFLKNE